MRIPAPIRLAVLLLTVAAVAAPAPALAQEKFPAHEVTLIVPWPAGGGSDISMRLIAEHAGKHLGAPVIVVNKPGAAGAIGHREIVSAKPDGYTVGMFGAGFVAQQYMIPNPVKIDEAQAVVFFGAEPGALSVRADTPWKSLKEFVEAAKARPNAIKNSNDPPGGASHLTAVVLERKLGFTLGKVPYQGFAPSVGALLAGEVQASTVPVPDIIQAHKAGQARILGVTADRRHFLAPDVPTFKEQGFDVVYGAWRIIAGPKGIPAERLKVLEEKLLATLRDPAFVAAAQKAGFTVGPLGSAETAAFLKQDDAQTYPILQELGMVKNPK
jgi:tripartite-type tricarboxylate transporter receptor subunit TctC